MNQQKMYNRKYKMFCNNCGKKTHNYSSCIEPITSIGIICVRYNQESKEFEYLLICRKDTLGFIDFMRGKYSVTNKSHLQAIINEMTLAEKLKLLKNDFDKLWSDLWHNNYGIKYRNEKLSSKVKFNNLNVGITHNDMTYTLESLIKESNTLWGEPEWEIPKGRRSYHERDIDTALREFEEETGIPKDNIHIVKNIIPYDEIFTGSNFKSYRQRYFVGILQQSSSLDNYQKCEVSNIKWVPFSELSNTIRTYSLEKLKVLHNINKVLETYRLIF